MPNVSVVLAPDLTLHIYLFTRIDITFLKSIRYLYLESGNISH